MNSIPRYSNDFTPVPEREEKDSDDRKERDANSEGTFSGYVEEEKSCTMCGNAAAHREKVQNIMMATEISQMKNLQSAKQLAGAIEEIRELKKTRQHLQNKLAHMMFLWREHLAEI